VRPEDLHQSGIAGNQLEIINESSPFDVTSQGFVDEQVGLQRMTISQSVYFLADFWVDGECSTR
jgi:hypothetical protein